MAQVISPIEEDEDMQSETEDAMEIEPEQQEDIRMDAEIPGEECSPENDVQRQMKLRTLRPSCPPKMSDPGEFMLRLRIEGDDYEGCLIDSGASGNVMPSCYYNPHRHPPLKPARIQIGLANGGVIRPLGRIEDLQVDIAGMTILQDFIVMDCAITPDGMLPQIILGRTFITTAGVVADGRSGRLTVEVLGSNAHFDRRGNLIQKQQRMQNRNFTAPHNRGNRQETKKNQNPRFFVRMASTKTKTQTINARKERFLAQTCSPSVYMDEAFLRSKGMYEDIGKILNQAGCGTLLNLKHPTNVEDTCEFLASIEYLGPQEGEAGGIRYMHRNVIHRASMGQIRNIFGWPNPKEETEPEELLNTRAYSELTGGKTFVPGVSLGKWMTDPKFWYLHRLITHTMTGRYGGSEKINSLDMTFLRGFHFGYATDYAHALCKHWQSRRPNGEILCGGIITYVLHALHGSEATGEATILEPETMNGEKVLAMQGCTKKKNAYIWNYHPEIQLEEGTGRKKKNTIVASTTTILERISSQENAAERRLRYAEARIMQYLAPAGINLYVDPPPDWEPGKPVAPEHEIPRDNKSEDSEATQ